MKIKLLKPYQLLVAEQKIDCIDSIAVELVKRGVAERIEDSLPQAKRNKSHKVIK